MADASNTNNEEQLRTERPVTKSKPRFSSIWLLPILALAIGAWMVYDNWQNSGIGIEVTFDTAEGIEADKTLVKYRNVDVGKVSAISFTRDRGAIVVSIKIDKAMQDFLSKDSQFWVVRPRIGAEGISGLNTVLSGAYISLSPGTSEELTRSFEGRDKPPVTSPNANGLFLTLNSDGSKPPRVGSPVTYRGFSVGRIESSQFDPETRTASYGVFIDAPYDSLITTNTFFWNSGGISVNATAEGVKVDIATIETLISGGVEFDVPEDLDLGKPVTDSRDFTLYDSLDSVESRRKYEYIEYALLVEDSVSGLRKGGVVEFRGIRIGTVESPYLPFEQTIEGEEDITTDPRIPVIIRVEPGRMYEADEIDVPAFKALMTSSIEKGLVARLQTANILTGTLKVSLNFSADAGEGEAEKRAVESYGPYNVIPTQRSGLDNLTAKVEGILNRIDKLPFEQTLENLNTAIDSTGSAARSTEKSMEEFQLMVRGLQPESPIYGSIQDTIQQLQGTLRNLQPLINELTNKPNALIFGSGRKADVEPKAESRARGGERGR